MDALQEKLSKNKASKWAGKKVADKIKRTTPSKVNSGEWILVVLALVTVDVIQIILDFMFTSGIIINRFIDILVGLSLALYLYSRGQLADKETSLRIIMVLVVSFGVEQVPILDAAPFWTGDGLYFWHLSRTRDERAKKEEVQRIAQEKEEKMRQQQIKLLRLQQIRQQQADKDLYDEAA